MLGSDGGRLGKEDGGNAMTAPALPAGKNRADGKPAEPTGRPRADSPREPAAPAEREYLREHIVLGYN
jgi:hypothetical protein